MKYPKRVARLTGNNGRRVVSVYQTARDIFRVYLMVNGKFQGSEIFDTKRAALAQAKSWT